MRLRENSFFLNVFYTTRCWLLESKISLQNLPISPLTLSDFTVSRWIMKTLQSHVCREHCVTERTTFLFFKGKWVILVIKVCRITAWSWNFCAINRFHWKEQNTNETDSRPGKCGNCWVINAWHDILLTHSVILTNSCMLTILQGESLWDFSHLSISRRYYKCVIPKNRPSYIIFS